MMKTSRMLEKFWAALTWVPPRCRWNTESPPRFTLSLNLLFGFLYGSFMLSTHNIPTRNAATFTVANLYYNHPILHILAEDFSVSNEQASRIPTLMQAGYASGLLFICPLGDIFRRRMFVLSLVFFTATVWLGLCLTGSFPLFLALSYITGATTVTPQLMLPLVGDLAPAERRATALSIVVSGLLGGMLVARLLSGILTQYTSWRTIYWFSFGVQYLILSLLYIYMPDYPSTNPDGLNYFKMLLSIVRMLFKHPLLVQACIVGFFTSTIFTNFWTTLTFLLSETPYNYSTVTIGLFALIGLGAMVIGPFYSRAIIDRFIPLLSVILGLIYCLIGTVVGAYTGRFTVAGPIINAFLIDIGIQSSQIANRTAIFGIEPKARNRVNTAYMVSVFCGQLVGTAVGNKLYAIGGWTISGSASVGFIGTALLTCFVRGPWETRWLGWRGGWSFKKRDLSQKVEQPRVEQQNHAGDIYPTAGNRSYDSKVAEDFKKLEADRQDRSVGSPKGNSPPHVVTRHDANCG